MNTKERIFQIIKKHDGISASDIAKQIGITRQAVIKHINKLINEEKIIKYGNTKGSKFYIFNKSPQKIKLSKIYKNDNLYEDKIFNEFVILLNIRKYITNNTYNILNYAFTELLNNAIEHSKSNQIKINMIIDNVNTKFIIQDFGIGIFYSIYKKFKLEDEENAIIELMKGKKTTMPDKHSGEGIFFTSKVCDIMTIRSHSIELIFDNIKKDVFLKKNRFIKGTIVSFQIKNHSNRSLVKIFNKYSPEEYNYTFSKTQLKLKLLKNNFISRSEAKRLLVGLEKFNEIRIDFKNVDYVGQGFIDEIFRVFKQRYSNKKIVPINTNKLIQNMIEHIKTKWGPVLEKLEK